MTKSCLSIWRKAMEFDPDEYQKFKYHRYVQKSYVPTPLRAPITTWEQTQTFLLKKLTFRQFLHTVCCNKRCNTNQLGKITINVKLLAVLNYRYMYIFKLYIVMTDTVQCS